MWETRPFCKKLPKKGEDSKAPDEDVDEEWLQGRDGWD